ncbi:MAG: HAD family hydrolase [Clostridiales bacterium]|nr:HAD family hydrolase [Clostridiales bacterium]
MNQKLIAIDLDGTLLRADGTISERNREAILRTMEQGHLVVPSTGRGYRNSRFMLKKFPVMPYYINANGTTVTQGHPEKSLFSRFMPYETGCAVYQTVMEYDVFVEIYHGLDAYDTFQSCANMRKMGCMGYYLEQLSETNIHMESLDDFVLREKRPISKFNIVCTGTEDKKELMDRLSKLPKVYPVSASELSIEIADGHWSKRDGLEWLCKKIGFAREQVIAIGDSDNDYEGICWAGTGVAMANANEKIRRAADFVVGTNNQDGVAQALEMLING